MKANIESIYDNYLNISTITEEGDDTKDNVDYNIYEVTSYPFLERLFQTFPFKEGDHLVDFGCGKGRVLFMASKHSCAYVTGIENNEKRFDTLQNNVKLYQQKHGAKTFFDLQNIDAQSAVINDTANKFFFFEPFQIKIYEQVMENILISLEKAPRKVTIFLYLPQENTLRYFDDIQGFNKEVYVDSTLYHNNESLVTMPYFAFYCNYSMEDLVDSYFLFYLKTLYIFDF